ncbi:M23 family metallopeptidase [Nanoarchaeota archaeon]
MKDFRGACSNPNVHHHPYEHSIDIVLPEGAPILAVKAGIVWQVKDDSNEGGLDPKYSNEKYLNYITIKHTNEEFSQYVHVQCKSSKVKNGDKVRKGQVIAKNGNTGFSAGPHLHFQVFTPREGKINFEILEVRFDKPFKIDKSVAKIPEIAKSTIKRNENKWKKLRKA